MALHDDDAGRGAFREAVLAELERGKAVSCYLLYNEDAVIFSSNDRLGLHRQNRYCIHHLLARITDVVETSSGIPSQFAEYIPEGRNRYETEHIWADHSERHTDEFPPAETISRGNFPIPILTAWEQKCIFNWLLSL